MYCYKNCIVFWPRGDSRVPRNYFNVPSEFQKIAVFCHELVFPVSFWKFLFVTISWYFLTHHFLTYDFLSFPSFPVISCHFLSFSWVKGDLIKLFSKWWDQKWKKILLEAPFLSYYLPSISSPFVCLINFFTPFPSSYFKSNHRFGLPRPRQRF